MKEKKKEKKKSRQKPTKKQLGIRSFCLLSMTTSPKSLASTCCMVVNEV